MGVEVGAATGTNVGIVVGMEVGAVGLLLTVGVADGLDVGLVVGKDDGLVVGDTDERTFGVIYEICESNSQVFDPYCKKINPLTPQPTVERKFNKLGTHGIKKPAYQFPIDFEPRVEIICK